jgi:hypothetical protein
MVVTATLLGAPFVTPVTMSYLGGGVSLMPAPLACAWASASTVTCPTVAGVGGVLRGLGGEALPVPQLLVGAPGGREVVRLRGLRVGVRGERVGVAVPGAELGVLVREVLVLARDVPAAALGGGPPGELIGAVGQALGVLVATEGVPGGVTLGDPDPRLDFSKDVHRGSP